MAEYSQTVVEDVFLYRTDIGACPQRLQLSFFNATLATLIP